MNNLQIKYPRSHAQINILEPSSEKIQIQEEIKKIELSEIYRHYLALKEKELELSRLKFTCSNCGASYNINGLILYRFVSYSDGPDEWRYEDDNVICPSCGINNYIKYKSKYSENGYDKNIQLNFREVKYINK